MERYPIFLSIVLNHVSDDTPEFSYAVTCLKLLFEMLGMSLGCLLHGGKVYYLVKLKDAVSFFFVCLGYKLWLRTTLSPSVMRNTLLGQSFHTRNEKSHKEIFDLFLPFLQACFTITIFISRKPSFGGFSFVLLIAILMPYHISSLIRPKLST